MNNTFEFIGNIVPCKESDKFHPYETVKFPNSDWGKKSIKFNVVCGNNRHLVESSLLINTVDPDNMQIYTYTKGAVTEDGTRLKGEKLHIAFKDRNKSEIIEKVAEFKKFVVDLEKPGRRWKLERAIDKFKDGSITDEQISELGISSLEKCQEEFDKSKKKKHEFISEYDFIDFLNKLVNSEEIKNIKFKIVGNYNVEYDDKNDRWYRHFNVQRVYRQNDDANITSQVSLGVVFGRDCVDDEDYNETKKAYADVYISQYVPKFHNSFFCPIRLTIDGNGDEISNKQAHGFIKKLRFPDTCDCDYREIGLICTVLNGSQEVELTEDMLTDEQRENIEYGLTTLEDIKAELGKPVYGDRVTDIVITHLAKGYSKGAQDTVFEEKDFCKPYDKNQIIDDEDGIFDDIEI